MLYKNVKDTANKEEQKAKHININLKDVEGRLAEMRKTREGRLAFSKLYLAITGTSATAFGGAAG